MILVDYMHLCNRILFTSIASSTPKKKEGQYVTEDFKGLTINGILTSFGYFIKEFKEYGEIVCCLEDKSWRRSFYPDYKGNRQDKREKSDINFEEVFLIFDEVAQALQKSFGIKTLKVQEAEGDDIIAVLTEMNSLKTQKTLIISSDKDFKQLFRYKNVDIYDPIKKEFRTKPSSLEEIEEEIKLHIIQGDDSDNIPNVTKGCVFSDNFSSFLKKNNIFTESPRDFLKLSVSEDLINRYDVFQVYKSGKNKGKLKDEKDLYKTTPLTKKKLEEVKNEIETDSIIGDNFKRNRILIDFNYIPENIKERIKETYKNTPSPKANPMGMMEFCAANRLKQLMGNCSVFLINEYEGTDDIDSAF